jgi:hypothetical protein
MKYFLIGILLCGLPLSAMKHPEKKTKSDKQIEEMNKKSKKEKEQLKKQTSDHFANKSKSNAPKK